MNPRGRFIALALLVAAAAGCQQEGAMTITLRSTAFSHNQPIPKKYTEDGDDVSPPLAWDGAPQGVQEFALICDDPDAPTPQPWVHWVIYKIPADCRSLPEGVPAQAKLDSPAGALQGRNSWSSGRTIGYRGPAPPSGTHHYHFRVYALDTQLTLGPDADKPALLKAMKGHILAEGLLTGTYKR
jgi:Raf kinase inhibitor-like YbhB/YbcL family protein